MCTDRLMHHTDQRSATAASGTTPSAILSLFSHHNYRSVSARKIKYSLPQCRLMQSKDRMSRKPQTAVDTS
ncbi:hypothetical protein GDO81_014255 [Engystomops pustulosus]|uniref:Uncharacterized protein n=1 Tax=Engystomops pustulosus TaxID=76066 RepID=A0AAV7B955_ENGPU|nr:hypothetical protein GDO81_014255 [Engystomops pustulosus]